MNIQAIPNNEENNWKEIKAKIHTKWSKISEAQLELFKVNLNLLAENVQMLYGISKVEAESQIEEFKAALKTVPSPKALDRKAKTNDRDLAAESA